jgi:hypothetical protein
MAVLILTLLTAKCREQLLLAPDEAVIRNIYFPKHVFTLLQKVKAVREVSCVA